MEVDDMFATLLGASTTNQSTAITTAARKRNVNRGEAYLYSKGYNPQRQFRLEIASYSDLERLAGRKIKQDYSDTKLAVAEILQREGFKYLDREKVRREDPYYRCAAGLKTLPGDTTFYDLKTKDWTPEEKRNDNILTIIGSLAGIAVIVFLAYLSFI